MVVNGKTFALGHAFLPVITLLLYLSDPHRTIPLLLVSLLYAGLAAYLLARSLMTKALNLLLQRKFFILCITAVDLGLLAAEHWLTALHQGVPATWFVLFIAPLYALALGSRWTTLVCALGLVELYLCNVWFGHPFWTTDTLLIIGGMLIFILIVGRSSDRMQAFAFFDPLTKLPNRAMFLEQTSLAIESAGHLRHRVAILLVDLDHFKYINDTMGHSAGDALLSVVAMKLKTVLPSQAVLCRMGGDEFAVLLPKLRYTDEAEQAAQAIVEGLKESLSVRHTELFITPSIGISLYPDDGTDTDSLMKNADTALYRAKDEGRNNYQFFTGHIGKQGLERIQMETAMRHALERDEFVVHYQPRIEADHGRLVCVEALVRWIHPEAGLIPPDQFIPLAEETGLIVPLGELVLRKACAMRSRWTEMGLPTFRVSVNLSPRQFRQLDLPEKIQQILAETNVDATLLELEITESAAMQDVGYANLMLRVLKEMNVSIAIDDFGTGYSSLGYLRRFPIDVLKIDRSFISGIASEAGNDEDAAIASTIIVLAHTMKLTVTAEGVETEEQQRFLQQQGCDELQGYRFGKPMRASELEAWLTHSDTLHAGSYRSAL